MNDYNQFQINQKKQKEDLDKKLKTEKGEIFRLQRSALEQFDNECKQKRAKLVVSYSSQVKELEISHNMQREALKEKLLNTKYEKKNQQTNQTSQAKR